MIVWWKVLLKFRPIGFLMKISIQKGFYHHAIVQGSTFSFPGSPGFFLWKKLPCFHSHYWTHNILTPFSFQFIIFNTMITPFSFQFIEVWTLGCVIPFNQPHNLRQFEVYQYKGGTSYLCDRVKKCWRIYAALMKQCYMIRRYFLLNIINIIYLSHKYIRNIIEKYSKSNGFWLDLFFNQN